MALSIPERSAEDRAAGILRVAVGGAEKRLPTLPMNAAETWIQGLGAQVASLARGLDGADGAGDIISLAALGQSAVLDAVASYDRSGALGGREWLRENADPEQLYVAFRQIVQVVFPFVRDLEGLIRQLPNNLVEAGLAALSQRSSTNGPSPSGASTPEPSAIASTPSSSPTSGRRARNGSAGSIASA